MTKQLADIEIGENDAVLVFSPESDDSYGITLHTPKALLENTGEPIPLNFAVAAQIHTFIIDDENNIKIIAEYFNNYVEKLQGKG